MYSPYSIRDRRTHLSTSLKPIDICECCTVSQQKGAVTQSEHAGRQCFTNGFLQEAGDDCSFAGAAGEKQDRTRLTQGTNTQCEAAAGYICFAPPIDGTRSYRLGRKRHLSSSTGKGRARFIEPDMAVWPKSQNGEVQSATLCNGILHPRTLTEVIGCRVKSDDALLVYPGGASEFAIQPREQPASIVGSYVRIFIECHKLCLVKKQRIGSGNCCKLPEHGDRCVAGCQCNQRSGFRVQHADHHVSRFSSKVLGIFGLDQLHGNSSSNHKAAAPTAPAYCPRLPILIFSPCWYSLGQAAK